MVVARLGQADMTLARGEILHGGCSCISHKRLLAAVSKGRAAVVAVEPGSEHEQQQAAPGLEVEPSLAAAPGLAATPGLAAVPAAAARRQRPAAQGLHQASGGSTFQP